MTTAPAAIFTAAEIPADRCPEMTRNDSGRWERCRRDAHPGTERHHIRGRSWLTGTPMPHLELGFTCTAPSCCAWPVHEVPYLGAPAKESAKAPRNNPPARPGRPGRQPAPQTRNGDNR